MNSYLRGRELLDSELPSIRRGGLLDSSVGRSRGVSFLDEAPFTEDRQRYAHATAPPYARPGSPTYYPRPPSPTQKHMLEVRTCSNLRCMPIARYIILTSRWDLITA